MSKYVFFLIFIELLIVTWIDLKKKIISNKWVIFNFLFFLCLCLTPNLIISKEHFYYPAFSILIGFFLYLLNIAGAGDSKYLSSLFLLIPDKLHWLFFETLLESTAVMGTVFLILKIGKNFAAFKSYFLSRYWIGIRDKIKSEFSYAPVILFSWIILGWKIWSH